MMTAECRELGGKSRTQQGGAATEGDVAAAAGTDGTAEKAG